MKIEEIKARILRLPIGRKMPPGTYEIGRNECGKWEMRDKMGRVVTPILMRAAIFLAPLYVAYRRSIRWWKS